MKAPPALTAETSGRMQQLALSVLAGLAGFIAPPAPFLRRGLWHCAALMGVFWGFALYVFFARYAGVGFLAHLGLASLGILSLLMPTRTMRLEAALRRLRRALDRQLKRLGP
jgi:hypothetical protein